MFYFRLISTGGESIAKKLIWWATLSREHRNLFNDDFSPLKKASFTQTADKTKTPNVRPFFIRKYATRRSHKTVSVAKRRGSSEVFFPPQLTHIPEIEYHFQTRGSFQLKRFDIGHEIPSGLSLLIYTVVTETTGIVNRFRENEGKVIPRRTRCRAKKHHNAKELTFLECKTTKTISIGIVWRTENWPFLCSDCIRWCSRKWN